jgi:hypothetical protein
MKNTSSLRWAYIISPKIEVGRPGKRWTDKWIFGTIPHRFIAAKVLRRKIILADKSSKASLSNNCSSYECMEDFLHVTCMLSMHKVNFTCTSTP